MRGKRKRSGLNLDWELGTAQCFLVTVFAPRCITNSCMCLGTCVRQNYEQIAPYQSWNFCLKTILEPIVATFLPFYFPEQDFEPHSEDYHLLNRGSGNNLKQHLSPGKKWISFQSRAFWSRTYLHWVTDWEVSLCKIIHQERYFIKGLRTWSTGTISNAYFLYNIKKCYGRVLQPALAPCVRKQLQHNSSKWVEVSSSQGEV